jgi:hypothetical protein
MDLVGVGTAVCGSAEVVAIYCGKVCVWPDPWTDLWDEGFPLAWEIIWRDLWSVDPAPPAVEEV